MDLPLIGLGTYRVKSRDSLISIVHDALRIGYRLIDTAQVYGNEHMVGEAIATADIPRQNLFVTTKVSPKYLTSEIAVYNSVVQSLQKLQLDYLDLVLIHWPGTSKRDVKNPNTENRRTAWKALEKLQSEKKVRFIGVSNYTPLHLQELFTYCTIKPYVNQIELHPLYIHSETLELCQQQGIRVQAYSSLGEGNLVDRSKDEFKVFDEIAAPYSCTRAQLLLKWALQRGVGVIPKSSSIARLKENFELDFFEISIDDMRRLDSLTTTGGFPVTKFCWDPSIVT
ncbi:NADP-dependent oxidoreductase domain-containing protein [Obelidium mucronatum]|nr:NADP-dependent oxidoreductase domain-containing protein [Obelidium mucronatum]